MRSRYRTITAAFIIFAITCSLSGTAGAAPSTSTSAPASTIPSSAVSTPELETARTRALELEQEIENLRGENIAIKERIDITNQRVFRQQEVLSNARKKLRSAQEIYQERMIRIYKSQVIDPLTVLLTAESITDLYARILILSRITQRDQTAYKDASIATAEAEYQAAYLDDLKRQTVELRHLQNNSLNQSKKALVEQNTLIDRLTAEAIKELESLRTVNALTRKEWLDNSIPIGNSISTVPATVDPYEDITFLVPAHQPTHYRTTGQSQTMVCSWYGNEFNGRPTASGQIFNEEDLTCASKTLPFGTRLALTRGAKRIIVIVTDRGPFITGRDLDLSKAAARLLGFSGVEPVTAEWVEVVD